jgi:hypothetical protein
MTYNFKEKAKFLRELGHPSHGEKDLQLLKLISPQHNLIKTAKAFPHHYAEKILYALLDLTTAERIREHRRENDNNNEGGKNDELQDGQNGSKDAPPATEQTTKEQSGDEIKETPGEGGTDETSKHDNVEETSETEVAKEVEPSDAKKAQKKTKGAKGKSKKKKNTPI